MTLEQALEAHQHKQMASLLEEQIKLEQSQRMRFQSELQVELARHRNAILEKQELAALKLRGQLEFEREQKGRRAEEDEEEVRRQSLHLTATAPTTAVESIEEASGVREASVQDQETDNKQLKNSTTTQAPYTTVAASIIDPRYRTMFGYRGPEHSKSTPEELAELEQERRNTLTATLTPPSSSSSSSVKDTATRIPAENRVRLAMMDYTPSQIEGMTLEQANVILDLRSAQPQEQEQQSSSSLKHTDTTTDTDTNTCAQTNGTKTATATAATVVSALVEDIINNEEEENRRTPRFAPDVMSSVSLHN
ncbi:hypothetical protein EC957_008928 [Mortierella hygrophila]|uniref:Uncharacterized protein n=1 Tax=Mortierella hygrophila TaxID=979708 RepID=A0A9P6K4X1_9FUNG|nr:hypothetical protein EC957_008928 [Mortierella hygrophila]